MKHLIKLSLVAFLSGLITNSSLANNFTSCENLSTLGNVKTIDFEGIATAAGNANAIALTGNEFLGDGISLTNQTGEGLFVGIPDSGLSPNNCVNFFAADFIPVSPAAVFSPGNCTNQDSTSPVGSVRVDFTSPVSVVGLYFLDPEGATSKVEIFDEAEISLGEAIATGEPDNSQAFRYIGTPGGDFLIDHAIITLGGGGDGVGMDNLCYVDSLPVTIDIKPGNEPNCFNINGKGVIPVAILGSDSFDVTTIDLTSIAFAGLDVRVRGNSLPSCSYEDTNGDGFSDLVCQFEDDPAAWSPGETNACVSGKLDNGSPINGCDTICVVP